MRTVSGTALLLLIAFKGAPEPGIPSPGLTKAQAIERAARFCRAVGLTPSGLPSASYPAVLSGARGLTNHWQYCWQISYADQAEVHVVDKAGIISWFVNLGHRERMSGPEGKTPGAPISEHEAYRKALAALTASGQTQDLLFEEIELRQHTNPATMSGHKWYVKWRRTFNRVPFRRYEHAFIALQAESGELDRFSLRFTLKPPVSGSFTISSDRAVAVARKEVASHLGEPRLLLEVFPEIVQPSYFSSFRTPSTPRPGPPRAAWVCRFDDSQPADPTQESRRGVKTYAVFVDAKTGAIIGLESGHHHDVPETRKAEVRDVLKKARQIKVFTRGTLGMWNSSPAAIISHPSHLISALRSSPTLRWYDSEALPDLKFELSSDSGESVLTMWYIASCWRLGGEGAWFTVSPEIAASLNELARTGVSATIVRLQNSNTLERYAKNQAIRVMKPRQAARRPILVAASSLAFRSIPRYWRSK